MYNANVFVHIKALAEFATFPVLQLTQPPDELSRTYINMVSSFLLVPNIEQPKN